MLNRGCFCENSYWKHTHTHTQTKFVKPKFKEILLLRDSNNKTKKQKDDNKKSRNTFSDLLTPSWNKMILKSDGITKHLRETTKKQRNSWSNEEQIEIMNIRKLRPTVELQVQMRAEKRPAIKGPTRIHNGRRKQPNTKRRCLRDAFCWKHTHTH